MAQILVKSAKSFGKCCSCGERWRTDEKFLQVVSNGRNIAGERYCFSCEDIARENNDIADDSDTDEFDAQQRAERALEDYATYRFNGCTEHYWTDRDAGYCE